MSLYLNEIPLDLFIKYYDYFTKSTDNNEYQRKEFIEKLKLQKEAFTLFEDRGTPIPSGTYEKDKENAIKKILTDSILNSKSGANATYNNDTVGIISMGLYLSAMANILSYGLSSESLNYNALNIDPISLDELDMKFIIKEDTRKNNIINNDAIDTETLEEVSGSMNDVLERIISQRKNLLLKDELLANHYDKTINEMLNSSISADISDSIKVNKDSYRNRTIYNDEIKDETSFMVSEFLYGDKSFDDFYASFDKFIVNKLNYISNKHNFATLYDEERKALVNTTELSDISVINIANSNAESLETLMEEVFDNGFRLYLN